MYIKLTAIGVLVLLGVNAYADQLNNAEKLPRETGQLTTAVAFASSNPDELMCAANAFRLSGYAGIADNVRMPGEGQVTKVSITKEGSEASLGTETLIKSLSACQSKSDTSTLSWSVERKVPKG